MDILYISSSCSAEKYEEIYRLRKVKSIEPQQKFNWLLAKGISEVPGVKVTALCGLPLSHSTCDLHYFEYEQDIVSDSLCFEYLPFRNGRLTRHYDFYRNSKRLVKEWIDSHKGKHSCIVVDALSPFLIMGSFGYAQKNSIPVVGIVTDLPELATNMKNRNDGILKGTALRLFQKMITTTLTKYNGYISLTQSINDVVNSKKKPECVIEGSTDSTLIYKKEREKGKRTVVYAGGVFEKYGLKILVDGFAMVRTDAELHIYGDGSYVQDIIELSKSHHNIIYKGMASLEEIVEIEREATLLVNPRPSSEEFSKYSFPSKTLEYMASGTPLLTTRLPGIPEDYFNYVYTIDDETANGIAIVLRRILALSDSELLQIGRKAFDFVMKEKTNKRQGEKIVSFIRKSF